MAKDLDESLLRAARADARRLETLADSNDPLPPETQIIRHDRMFNLRLTDEQFAALQDVADARHLPVSTMARAWLLDRLDHEREVG